MKKQYVVKDYIIHLYYQGNGNWGKMTALSHYFESKNDAITFLNSQEGTFVIETVYIV